ncbi:alcohol oxidase [Schizophyllum commune Tattone D]|nr:alcohol oxidase [Schizophyllum commune Tattone D]
MLKFLSLALAAASYARATPLTRRASGVTNSADGANGQEFDYIIVGGGLAGMVVAARLAEDPSITVLTIEAGADNRDDPRVYDIYNYGQAAGTELDWAWPADQGRTIVGGKTLGGSSSINGGHWTRGMQSQYEKTFGLLDDAQEKGWTWDGIFEYMKKAETWSAPNDQQKAKGAQSVDEYHGTQGPVQTTFPDGMYGGPQQGAFIDTITNVSGIPHLADINGGDSLGVAYTPQMMNWHDNDYRSSSPQAYLTPVEDARTNWLTLTEHTATKITWSTTSTPATASGVEFAPTSGGDARYTATAKREVIVAGGAIQSPALLQLSGVGDSSHLSSLGIDAVVDLPTVGKNLQEQTMNSLGAHGNGFDKGGRGPSGCIAYVDASGLFLDDVETKKQQIQESIAGYAQSLAGSALSEDALKEIFGVQADLILNDKAPLVELFFDSGYPDDLGIDMWQLLPFSRGTVQIDSADPFQKPIINVNYFAADFDLDVQVAGAKLSRTVLNTSPLSDLSVGETIPGSDVADDASDDDWAAWIKNGFSSVHHPIATCAMMKRELGGVVDSDLKVYDTANVRVVDASVLALQVSAHLSSTLYGIAEKAADIIKAAQ